MTLAESLTPKRTEEIKPGLFIQKTVGGKYRQIHPAAWGGKIRWKEQLSSVISFRFLFTMAVIIFLVFAYNQDNAELIEFQNYVMNNTADFCGKWEIISTTEVCLNERLADGSCNLNGTQTEEALKNIDWVN